MRYSVYLPHTQMVQGTKQQQYVYLTKWKFNFFFLLFKIWIHTLYKRYAFYNGSDKFKLSVSSSCNVLDRNAKYLFDRNAENLFPPVGLEKHVL